MQQLKEQLTSAKADLQDKITVFEKNKTDMDAILAQIEASQQSEADKAFAREQYEPAHARNERMLARSQTALARIDAQLARCDDAAVKAKVDDIMAFFTDNSVSELNRLSENQLYQSNDDELDRLKKIKDNAFLDVEQKTKLLTGKLILD